MSTQSADGNLHPDAEPSWSAADRHARRMAAGDEGAFLHYRVRSGYQLKPDVDKIAAELIGIAGEVGDGIRARVASAIVAAYRRGIDDAMKGDKK